MSDQIRQTSDFGFNGPQPSGMQPSNNQIEEYLWNATVPQINGPGQGEGDAHDEII